MSGEHVMRDRPTESKETFMSTPFVVVYVTAPPGRSARGLAKEILKSRSAACVNIIASVHSSYWWKGKLESAKEALLVIKTKRALVPKLMNVVRKNHPYTVPEIIAVPIVAGHKPYLDWLQNEAK